MTVPALPDDSARTRIAGALDQTLFVEAGAGSGKTRSLVDRVVALVGSGVELRHVAAITFTEKAAAELRDRIRVTLEGACADATLDAVSRGRLGAALEQLDGAAISTLHAFAQRILAENPIEAGLPPDVAVLDEVASEIEFEDRWRGFRDRLLADPALRRCLLLAFAADVRLADIRHLAKRFEANWDLVGTPGRVPWDPVEPPAVDTDDLLGALEALLARRDECTASDDLLHAYLTDEIAPFVVQLVQAPDQYAVLRLLVAEKPTFRCSRGRKGNWADKESVADELRALGGTRARLAADVAQSCLRRIAVEVARFTLDAATQRRTSGRLAFHDLLVLARDVLRGPMGVDVRGRLRQRYQRLLLDEFQDTDPIQIDLAVLIASADADAAGKAWQDIPVEPGRLFFVGDPKQSIYRFRRADIQLFLSARDVFGDPVALTTNFRASPSVIGWVNHVFAELIQAEAGSQPAYRALDAAPTRTDATVGPPVAVLGGTAAAPDLSADELRAREAADVAGAVVAASGWQVSERGPDGAERWRDATLGDITILLPARTSLAELERALDARGIPYRADASSLVYATREVRDLMATLRAVSDPTDQLALATALRSPVFGCGDDDLFTYRVRHAGAWSLLVDPPADLDDAHPVGAAMRYLKALHAEQVWLTPSELAGRVVRDRRLLELAYATGRPRDVWRRLRFVVDQARAWSEAEGGTLREYLEWARLQASESARVAETILPETDDESVRIMTIHAAKGLQFPIAIVSGMTTTSRGHRSRVEVTFPPAAGPVGLKVGRQLVTPEYATFQPIDEQMDFHERLRLLYVACTRAKDHLVVSLHRKQRRSRQQDPRRCTNAELVAQACAELDLPEAAVGGDLPPRPSAAVASEALPDLVTWETERTNALVVSGRWRSVGASDVALLAGGSRPSPPLGQLVLPVDGRGDPGLATGGAHVAGPAGEQSDAVEISAEIAAGAAKQPRDLELPPWQKGRYGTAIGRAVHAVLQTIDLATGEGLEETAAGQAAAEGVTGRESDVVRLARAALDAPSVREAVGCRRWRETYVAVPVGDRTLEGYVDLLYRTDAGLVVVDYKTASSAADLDARMAVYRAQGGAYALAVGRATGETVARVVFVFLTAAGAVERDLDDLAGAQREVVRALAG